MSYKRTSPMPIAEGGTAAQSFTAYAPISSGATSTTALQSVSSLFGNTGYALQGGSTIPVWKYLAFTSAVVSVTNAQVKAAHGTPIQLLAAPGAAQYYFIEAVQVYMKYGGSNVFTAGAAQTLGVYYGTTNVISAGLNNASIVASASRLSYPLTKNGIAFASSACAGTAVNLWNPIATEITGNAANDNTVEVVIAYTILDI